MGEILSFLLTSFSNRWISWPPSFIADKPVISICVFNDMHDREEEEEKEKKIKEVRKRERERMKEIERIAERKMSMYVH